MSLTDLTYKSQSEKNTYRCSIKSRSPQSWLMFALAHIVCRATTVASGNTVHSRFQEPVAMQPTEYFPNQTMPSPHLIPLSHAKKKLTTINVCKLIISDLSPCCSSRQMYRLYAAGLDLIEEDRVKCPVFVTTQCSKEGECLSHQGDNSLFFKVALHSCYLKTTHLMQVESF